MPGAAKLHEIISTAFHILAIVFTLAALVPFAILSFWALDTRRPLENVSVRFDHWHPKERAVAILTWTADRTRVCPGVGYVWLFGDRPYSLPSVQLPPPRASADVGKKGVRWQEAIQVPVESFRADKGKLYLNIRLTWQCNPLQAWSPLILDLPEIPITVPGKVR